MPSGRIFNDSVFNSYAQLKNFFIQSDSIDQVLSRKNKPYSKVLIPKEALFSCNSTLPWKWKVCQIASFPLRFLIAVPISLVHDLAALVYNYTLSKWFFQVAKKISIWVQYINAGFVLFSDEATKQFQIKTSINRVNSDGEVVNRHPPIPASRFIDLELKNITPSSGIKFNHVRGFCLGMSLWFIYLYLKTKEQFIDTRAQMAAIGKQFVKGAGMDPTLIQNLFEIKDGKILGLKMGTQAPGQPLKLKVPLLSGKGIDDYSTEWGIPIFKAKTNEWKSSSSMITDKLQTLPVGAYLIVIPGHSMSYIKIRNSLGYFFDPNTGIREIRGSRVGEKLHEMISEQDTLKIDKWLTELGEIHALVQLIPVTSC